MWRYSQGRRLLSMAKTADFTLKQSDSGGVYSNLGASAAVTYTLPQTALKGHSYSFMVQAQQTLLVSPGAAGAFYHAGAKQADNTALRAGSIGATITVVCDGNSDWLVVAQKGVWSVTASAIESAPWQEVQEDSSLGWIWQDMFTGYDASGYTSYADSGCTVAGVADEGGFVRLTTSSTNNHECGFALGDGTGAPFVMTHTSGTRLWFEAEIRTDTIANTKTGIFCGLTQEGLATADALIADAGTLADKDFVGFHRLEGDGDTLDTVFLKSGGSQQTVAADAITLVADTWVRIGMYFTPSTVTFFKDGVALAATADATHASFPSAEELTFTMAVKNAAAGAQTADIRNLRIIQMAA